MPHSTPSRTQAQKLSRGPLLPATDMMMPKNIPIHRPFMAPDIAARPQLMRPVMRSTWRRSVPMIARC